MKYLKRYNESVEESSMDFLEEYEFFVDESNPDRPIYHEYRKTIESDDADEYSVWTPKGNIEIIVMSEDDLKWNKDVANTKYRRLGDITSVENHFMSSSINESDEYDWSEEKEILNEIMDDWEKENDKTIRDRDEVTKKLIEWNDNKDNMNKLPDLYDEYGVSTWEDLMKEFIDEIQDGVFDEDDKPKVNYQKVDAIYRKWVNEASIMTPYGLLEWLEENYNITEK